MDSRASAVFSSHRGRSRSTARAPIASRWTVPRRCSSGEALVLFPEGTRGQGPVVEELHEGAAFLAARTGAPIIPIGVGGTRGHAQGLEDDPAREGPRGGGRTPATPRGDRSGAGPAPASARVTGELRAELQRVYDGPAKSGRPPDGADRRR